MESNVENYPRIWLSAPHMGGQERALLDDAFASNWIAPLGPHVDSFEAELASYLEVPYVAVVTSGTAAIHLALILSGVSHGDEVLVSSFTFSASANPIVYQGAKPAFIGSERQTLGMCPNALEEALRHLSSQGRRPKAVIGVDLFGIPENNAALEDICARYDVPFIEDAAEALGSRCGTRKAGSFGKFGILSFNGNKIITTSGGGALVTQSKPEWERARFLATQARDPAPHYQHSVIGYNYRMSNLIAAVGRGQLQVLDRWAQKRAANRKFYQRRLADQAGISFIREPEGCFWNSWLTVVEVDSTLTGGVTKSDIMGSLAKKNIESRPVWKPLHLQPVFSDCQYFGSALEEQIFERGLCLPSGSALTEVDLERVVGAIKECLP